MSREVRRVPEDFDWPLHEVWSGYVMPDSLRGDPCPECQGGQTFAGWWLQRFCQRLEMLACDVRDQASGRPMHPWLAEDPYPVTDSTHLFERATKVQRPSADMLALIAGLTGEPESEVGAFGGRDYRIYQAIAKAAGVENFGHCLRCDGEGTLEKYPGQLADAEAWTYTEPPTGEGWQLWETVSEGSPISPVFADRDGLIDWISSSAYDSARVGPPISREQAEKFVNAGWAPSGVFSPETGFLANEAAV